ncbi:MAG: hypothetical protein WC822_03150 [Candidatus Paceibacterota bacterium]|jgi:hypothetical protein
MKKNILKKESGHVTTVVFEKGMDFMAKSFAKVFDKLDNHNKLFTKVFDKLDRNDEVIGSLLKEMQNYSKDAREHRMTMSGLNHSDINQEREIEGLKIRIERLEQKVK